VQPEGSITDIAARNRRRRSRSIAARHLLSLRRRLHEVLWALKGFFLGEHELGLPPAASPSLDVPPPSSIAPGIRCRILDAVLLRALSSVNLSCA
jgi:hypothetical protein